MTVKDDTANTEIEYNWDNKLRSATQGPNSIRVKYDPMGNRVWKNSGATGQRKYVVDIAGNLPTILLEINPSNGSIVKTYVYANGQILLQHPGSADAQPPDTFRYYYLHDRLGSVREIIDKTGQVVNHYTYRPFGQTIESSSDGSLATGDGFTFAG
jgi:uncharacterized protein RhaS with RHS repeats